jgi:hypothetical protein
MGSPFNSSDTATLGSLPISTITIKVVTQYITSFNS